MSFPSDLCIGIETEVPGICHKVLVLMRGCSNSCELSRLNNQSPTMSRHKEAGVLENDTRWWYKIRPQLASFVEELIHLHIMLGIVFNKINI